MKGNEQGILLALTVLLLFAWIIFAAYWSTADLSHLIKEIERLPELTDWFPY